MLGLEAAHPNRSHLMVWARGKLLEGDREGELSVFKAVAERRGCSAYAAFHAPGASDPQEAPSAVLVARGEQERRDPAKVIGVKV